jgi:hypothetical protein
MASTLTVNIIESITLENGNKMDTFNTVAISNVNQILRRTDTITTSFSGSGIELVKFVDSEEQQTAGSFVKSDVKYMRFTHISGSSNIALYLVKTNDESTIFELEPGKSIMFGNSTFNASTTNDYPVEGYVDELYYSNFVYYDTIKAKSLVSSSLLEYTIASF